MKKLVFVALCCVALGVASSYGGAELKNTQNLAVWTSSSSVPWFYAEWDFVAGTAIRTAGGVGSSVTVPWYGPSYDRYYAAYFYDYSIGNYYSIMYFYWDRF